MSSYYQYNAHQHLASAHAPTSSHNHHAGRSRRAPRLSTSQNSHKQFRGVRSMKELTDTATVTTFRQKFEAGRSFELDDDMEFCPALLTENDLVSIHSSSSDRSSLASGSPNSSPTQLPSQQVSASFSLNSQSNPYIPFQQMQQNMSNLKMHQPAATRMRNAIPIVNPSTGISMPSPPQSASPARMQGVGRRW